MRRQWQQWIDGVARLSLRERSLLLLVSWVIAVFPLWSWWLEPTWLHWQQMTRQLQEQHLQVQQAQSTKDALVLRLRQDPNQATRQALQLIALQLQQLDKSLTAQTAGLIPAARMAETLQQMLAHSGRLQLLALSSLKPTPVLPEKSAVNYYRHGIRLVLQGRYTDIYDYLRELEALPQHFYWQTLHYRVEQYPQGTVEVILYTLGDSKEFIRG